MGEIRRDKVQEFSEHVCKTVHICFSALYLGKSSQFFISFSEIPWPEKSLKDYFYSSLWLYFLCSQIYKVHKIWLDTLDTSNLNYSTATTANKSSIKSVVMVKYSSFISLKKIHLTQIIKAIKSNYSKSKSKFENLNKNQQQYQKKKKIRKP